MRTWLTDLGTDSDQLVTAITNGIKEVTTDLSPSISGDDFGYVSSITPSIYESAGPGTYTFDIPLEVPEDSSSYGSDSLTLVIDGYGEVNLDIEIARVDATGDSSDDSLSGDAGPNGLYGLAGNDTLSGDSGDNILEGGAGDDTLSGGLGNDIFIFNDGDGKDVITDFTAGADTDDVIDLRNVSSVGSFAAVAAASTQVGADTVIDLGDGDQITLLDTDARALDVNDFLV